MSQPSTGNATTPTGMRLRYWERVLRLWSGLVLFSFVLMHLLNHAIGIFGVEVMTTVQPYRIAIWQSWPGTVLLYGSAAVHITVTLRRVVFRRTWRMPLRELVQIGLGLAIPVLVYEHALGTHYAHSVAGTDQKYPHILDLLWSYYPLQQPLLILVVWVHGCIGIYHVISIRPWYKRIRDMALALAVSIPALAIAGFISAGREALGDGGPAAWTRDQVRVVSQAGAIAEWAMIMIALSLVLSATGLALWRRFGARTPVKLIGHGMIEVPHGSTLLDGTRASGIPHPSLCGGRARCSTCRVLILSGDETLPDPGPLEAELLRRISAPKRVRLACQIRPKAPLTARILLPKGFKGSLSEWSEEDIKLGASKEATVLIVDVRGFTRLTQSQLPYDTIVLLNRFVAEMRQAGEAHGGKVMQMRGDGLMVVFGMDGQAYAGSRAAIAAASDMKNATDALNEEFSSALPQPLRIGIGVNTGVLIVGGVGDEDTGFEPIALGDTVLGASRLEAATKSYFVDCLVSRTTFRRARFGDRLRGRKVRINVPGHDREIVAYELWDRPETASRPAPDGQIGPDSQTETEDRSMPDHDHDRKGSAAEPTGGTTASNTVDA